MEHHGNQLAFPWPTGDFEQNRTYFMSTAPPPPSPAQSQRDKSAADAPPDAAARLASQQAHHVERLTRLFRHASQSTDDDYLKNIIKRHRGIEP
jgi:hypothetical protein